MLFQNYLDGVILFQLEENQKNKSKVIYMNACAEKIFDPFSKGCDKINKQVFKPFFNESVDETEFSFKNEEKKKRLSLI
jgi:hypothetical protein